MMKKKIFPKRTHKWASLPRGGCIKKILAADIKGTYEADVMKLVRDKQLSVIISYMHHIAHLPGLIKLHDKRHLTTDAMKQKVPRVQEQIDLEHWKD